MLLDFKEATNERRTDRDSLAKPSNGSVSGSGVCEWLLDKGCGQLGLSDVFLVLVP